MKAERRTAEPAPVEGQSETFAASAPRELLAEVRARTRGRGAFSQFIARAIFNELVAERRREVLADMAGDGAEVDVELSTRLQKLFARRTVK